MFYLKFLNFVQMTTELREHFILQCLHVRCSYFSNNSKLWVTPHPDPTPPAVCGIWTQVSGVGAGHSNKEAKVNLHN